MKLKLYRIRTDGTKIMFANRRDLAKWCENNASLGEQYWNGKTEKYEAK